MREWEEEFGKKLKYLAGIFVNYVLNLNLTYLAQSIKCALISTNNIAQITTNNTVLLYLWDI